MPHESRESCEIAIIGAGAWGTALAETLAARGHDVVLWAHEPEVADEINRHHRNERYLAGVPLAPAIRATHALSEIGAPDIVLLVVPAQHSRRLAKGLAAVLASETPVVLCAKGFEQASGKLLGVVVREELAHNPLAVLSGPSFAREVAAGLPVAVTLACEDTALGERLARTLAHRAFRVYWSDDMTGVQVGGATKNVLAIAAGIVAGRGLGRSAHAGLVARGFAELTALGRALGARPETLAGLSGLGDLVLTASSPMSRNYALGYALGEGESLAAIMAARHTVAEGVYTAEAIMHMAGRFALELPISQAVHDIVSGRLEVGAAVERLLARPLKPEQGA